MLKFIKPGLKHGSLLIFVALLLTACGLPTSTAVPHSTPTASAPPLVGLATRTPTTILAPTATASPASPTAIPTPSVVPQGKILVWEQISAGRAEVLRRQAEAFQQLYPAVQFDIRHIEPESFTGQLTDAGKDGPNLIIAPAKMAGEWQQARLILPMEPLFEPAFWDRFVPTVLDGVRDDNRIWGVPFDFGHSLALFYNKKLISLDKIPANWEALTIFVRQNAAKPGQFYPLTADLFEPDWLLGALSAYGGRAFDQSGQPTLNMPEMRQAFQFLQDAIYKNKLIPIEPNYLQMQLLFRTGRLALVMGDSENLVEYLRPEWSKQVEPGIGRLPLVNGRPMIMPSYGTAYFLGSNAQDDTARLAALRLFLAFTSQPEQQRDLVVSLKTLPPTEAGLKDPVVRGDPFLAALADQFQYTRALPPSLTWKALLETVRLPISNVVLDRASAADGAAALQDLMVKRLKGS